MGLQLDVALLFTFFIFIFWSELVMLPHLTKKGIEKLVWPTAIHAITCEHILLVMKKRMVNGEK